MSASDMHYRIKCITELKGEHEIHNTKMLKLFKDKIKENKIKGDFLRYTVNVSTELFLPLSLSNLLKSLSS